MKSLRTSTTAALLSLSIGISGLVITSNTSSKVRNPNPINYSQLINMQNKNSCNGKNPNTTMNISKSDIITQQNLIEIKSCLDEEPAEFGEDISYLDFFYSLRNQDNYEHIISLLCSFPKKYLLSLAVLLSKINYNDLKNIEKSLVIDLLHENSLQFQEYALTTISIWNNPELLSAIIDVQIDNIFLQRRLDKIVNRFSS